MSDRGDEAGDAGAAGRRTGHGLVALGDSVTVGEGQSMLGTYYRSWALWLAMALELAYTNLAVNGARAADLGAQLARLDGDYRLGCLYVGVNDARAVDFDAGSFAAHLRCSAATLRGAAGGLLMATIPLDLGRPRAGASVPTANRIIREVAGEQRAVVVDLEDVHGWQLVLPDAVHLTARGQLEVAARAATALAAAGVAVGRSPIALAGTPPGPRAVLRYALTGHAAALARDLWRRARERASR